MVPKTRIFHKADYAVFAVITLLIYAVIVYAAQPWFASEDRFAHPVTFWLLTVIFGSRLAINQFRWWVLPFMAEPVRMPARPGVRVGVATTFVSGAESIRMLEESLKAMIAMRYPHETWVLDEHDDPEVKALCARMGASHFSRKNMPCYQTESGTYQSRSKHGNYNSWLNEVGFDSYEIITTFDPDHIPEPKFLDEVLGYFEDPEIGYVQAAQAYYNQKASFIARGAAEETYAYYSSTQMCCFAMDYPIVTGCHNTHRSSALKQVGGFAAHDADDLLITLLYRVSAWKGVYVPKILARGLTPVDWDGYFKQQLRWARSVLDIKFRIYPKMAGKLPFKEIVVSFLHGFYYLQGISTFFILMLVAYMLAAGSVPQVVSYLISANFFLLLAVLFVSDLYRQRFYLGWPTEAGIHWRAGILQFAKYPYLLFALFHVVFNRRFPYVLTNKSKAAPKAVKVFIPHLVVAGLIIAAWAIGVAIGNTPHRLLQLFAAVSVIGTIIVAGTSFRKFPDPYSPDVSASAIRSGPRCEISEALDES